MKKLSIKSLIPFGVVVVLFGVVALGMWVVFGNSDTSAPKVADEKKQYSVDIADAQTYEAQADDNFTFQYPQKYNVTEIPFEGGAKKILVESTEPKKGFEVTVLPFDEAGPLTASRIKRDLPNIVMENPRTVILNSIQDPALAFNSTDETIGSTFEIWFNHGGYLYQALTYPEFADEMAEILQTWQFK